MRTAVVLAMVGACSAALWAQPQAQVPGPAYPTPRPGPYTLGPESQPQPDTPAGVLTKDTLPPGKVYPGVPHDYAVYVPANYDASRPAPVMIFADGVRSFCGASIQAPVVLDNLIAKKAIPPIVGIFVDPGIMPALDPDTQQARYHRIFEYDTIDGRFARFLVDELMPAVAAKYHLNLSADPSDRAIAGVSTGAVAAFMAAWERPDQFRRVLSYIGTFVDMKGANTVPFLIRKTEPRPLRIFLQDGINDQNMGWGSWFQQNQAMDWALTLMRYDHTFVVGTDGHSSAQGGAILPEALRWLWRDYPTPIAVPAPIAAGVAQDASVGGGPAMVPATFNVVSADKGWEPVGETYPSAASPAGDKDGAVYFADPRGSRIYKADAAGRVTVFAAQSAGARTLRVGADGRLYAAQPALHRLVSYAPTGGAATTVAQAIDVRDFVLTQSGAIYFTETGKNTVGLIAPGAGARRIVYAGGEIDAPSALTLSPDQSRLEVMDARGKFGWSFQCAKDGALVFGQPFWRLEFSEQADMRGIDGITVDAFGYLYVPTVLGIELSNQTGRVEHIVNKPTPTSTITHVAFAGADRTWLYVTTTDGKVYRRQLARTGVAAWAPVKPPVPRL